MHPARAANASSIPASPAPPAAKWSPVDSQHKTAAVPRLIRDFSWQLPGNWQLPAARDASRN
ncbi:hypothetical protein CDO09_13860 [Xanthomonas perforans]|nr:hypothetical protein Xcom_19570 [Xanthomonas axonopodis pv. commiphoreae]PWH22978.1 hypothetical protein CDO09_13860 [Xanthomonas perforans]